MYHHKHIGSPYIRQGLSNRAQNCPVTVTKMWTLYGQTKIFYYFIKKIKKFRSFTVMLYLGSKQIGIWPKK